MFAYVKGRPLGVAVSALILAACSGGASGPTFEPTAFPASIPGTRFPAPPTSYGMALSTTIGSSAGVKFYTVTWADPNRANDLAAWYTSELSYLGWQDQSPSPGPSPSGGMNDLWSKDGRSVRVTIKGLGQRQFYLRVGFCPNAC